MTTDEILNQIPRHPADERVAYGRNLNPDIIVPYIRERKLLGAVFQDYCKIPDSPNNDLGKNFREACGHFTGFFASIEKGHNANLDNGIAVMRGIGNSTGISIDDTQNYQGNKNLMDFLKDKWLIDQIKFLGNHTKEGLGEFGYHIFHAPAGKTSKGYASFWHTHEDITSHFTMHGAGLQWLPGHVDLEDTKKAPEKYEDMIQNADPGDLLIMGRLVHRSSHDIPEKGQFAVITHGPYYSND